MRLTPIPPSGSPVTVPHRLQRVFPSGQQKRQALGFSWVTTVGNDVDDEVGQKIHIAWNSTASPSEKSYATINDNPDAITFSWECTTSPVSVTGHRPTSHMEIDCSKLKPATVKAIQDKLWGTDAAEATRLPPTS